MEALKVRNLKLNEEEVDGISFSLKEEDSKKGLSTWEFTIMKLNNSENENFHKHELGYKYQIVLYNNDDTVEVFEAIIGDIEYYVKNLINVNQEGFIIKKSKKSEEILNKIFKGKLLEALANGLVAVANKKAEHAV